MPFSFLLWNCLVPGATSVSESGVSANLQRGSDESVLAFRIDTDGFRKRFNLSNPARVCDALFFYKVKESDPLLMFVELKGRDVAGAIQQLEQTLSTVRRELEQRGELVPLCQVNGDIVCHQRVFLKMNRRPLGHSAVVFQSTN